MTTIATLLSGGEGVGVGARMVGLDHLWGIEYDDAIAQVARANGFHTITADVTAVDFAPLPAPDILHASPPCPNFSVAKTNRGETEQDRAIAGAVCAAIETLLPRVFTLENVRGYAGSESLKRIGETLMALDYAVETFVVNAADYGVPQTRERLFLVARRGGWMRAPLLLPRKTRWIGWYEAIADILDTLPPSQFAPWQLARLPDELRESVLMDGTEMRKNGVQCAPEPPAHTVKAESYKGVPRAFIVNGTSDMAINGATKPAQTVVSTIHSKVPRAAVHGRVVAMTPRALARFQSFPDEYMLPDKKALACRIIGNAVPPKLYAALIGAVLEQI